MITAHYITTLAKCKGYPIFGGHRIRWITKYTDVWELHENGSRIYSVNGTKQMVNLTIQYLNLSNTTFLGWESIREKYKTVTQIRTIIKKLKQNNEKFI